MQFLRQGGLNSSVQNLILNPKVLYRVNFYEMLLKYMDNGGVTEFKCFLLLITEMKVGYETNAFCHCQGSRDLIRLL